MQDIVGGGGRGLQSARLAVVVLSLVMPGCGRTPAAAPPPRLSKAELNEKLGSLESAVIARLQLMPEVARAKFATSTPVFDADREAVVRTEFLTLANQRGVPGWLSELAVTGQMNAARAWQEVLIDEWNRSPPPMDAPVRDLVTELRPEIDRATADLLACLAEFPHTDARWQSLLRRRVESGDARPAEMPERIWWLAWEPFVGGRNQRRRLTVQRDGTASNGRLVFLSGPLAPVFGGEGRGEGVIASQRVQHQPEA
ncbi:MAG: hypothetical protein SH850_25945 [Planctomycetaceae bacterium]|nr:hypothetical protein [Planctomycetaceae bacterium]